MASNVLDVRVVFDSNDMNKNKLKLSIKLIRGVISVKVRDGDMAEEEYQELRGRMKKMKRSLRYCAKAH